MDVEITQQVKVRKRRRFTITIAVAALILLGLIWLMRLVLNSSISRSEFVTARVEIGSVENTINASGEVLPEFEEIITSPINGAIKNVMVDAGTKVKPGQPVLELDKSASENEYEKLKFQLEDKRNEIAKLRLNLDQSFFDVKSNNDIKRLKIGDLSNAVENARRLYKAGGGTREDIEQAELNLKIAKLEKEQLENEVQSKQKTMLLEEKAAELAASIQESDLKQLERKLKLADVSATRNGVITYVNKNIGANVKEGETLLRIADLSSFKIGGSLADSYLDQLHKGMPVIVRINDTELQGHVSNISPSIQNNLVNFDIQLNDRANKQLRPHLKVDVYLVTAVHNKVMRVANGAAFKSASPQDIFVLDGDGAQRRSVHTGLSNFDYIELLDGVKPGDQVITSDMSSYKNARRLKITN